MIFVLLYLYLVYVGAEKTFDSYYVCGLIQKDFTGFRSTCIDTSTERGHNQRIISFSFFGKSDIGHFHGIYPNLKGFEKFYPGYVIRL